MRGLWRWDRHSFEVHCRSYPWGRAVGATENFERANAALMVA